MSIHSGSLAQRYSYETSEGGAIDAMVSRRPKGAEINMEYNEEIGYGSVFFIPLSEEQFALLGKITANMAHIERCIDDFIMITLKIRNFNVLMAIIDGKMLSGKIELLSKILDNIIASDVIKKMKDACSSIKAILAKRNDAIHGIWGYWHEGLELGQDGIVKPLGKDPAGRPAAYNAKRPNNPLLASELPKLLSEVERIVKSVDDVHAQLVPNNPKRTGALRIRFTKVPPAGEGLKKS
ncbi:hypothetical protein KXS07_03905 [Inquilinus limosus]|uniref:hypothetical protein n=1 Tax=Inquilinus limosus TaxID=171674 RepID=UPI003F160D18